MNQKFIFLNPSRPLRLYPDQVGALREQSLPQSRIKNPESKITIPRKPLLLLLTLSLLSSFTSFAWDDDDDTDSKPFHRSNYNQQSSVIDYGYKNPYQASSSQRASAIDFGGPKRLAQVDDDDDSKPFHRSNYNQQSSANDYGYKNNNQQNSSIDYGYKNPYQVNSTHRSSAIDLGGPKRLAQAEDDDDSKPFSQSRIKNQESKITYTSPQQTYEASRVRALHVDTIQESVALRDRESKEMMAESQRSFEEQEADQKKSRAQMAKQQEIYDKMDREEGEMAEFLGGVYKAKFGATTGRNSAVTTDGYVYRSGDTFVTPKGIYTKTGNTYAGPGSFTTQTGTLFFGNEGTTIQAGGAYFSEGESGFIVAPNTRNTSTWRTR